MNSETGHLVTSNFMEKLFESGAIRKAKNVFMENAFSGSPYTPLPDELEHAAHCALDGKEETHISMTSGGKLSKWAAIERKAKRKRCAKQIKESRRKNR